MERSESIEKRKSILIVSPWAERWSLGEGAGVSDDYYFMRKALERGFEVHILAPGRRGSPAEDGLDYHRHHYPDFFRATSKLPAFLRRILWPLFFTFTAVPAAVAVARRVKPAFVLGHSHYAPLATMMVGRMLRIPCAVKLFGVMDLVHTEWSRLKYYYKNCEQIIAFKIPQDAWIILDDGTRGKEAAMRHGVEEQRIHFLPNGINVEWSEQEHDRFAVRRTLAIDEDTCLVLFLARFVASKRPDALVRAVPRVLELSLSKTMFLFAGDGPEREACEALARELGISSHVRFIGSVEHSRVPAVMSASDVFVSTSNLTNMAIPTCEAMVCGLPVAAFDVGDTSRVVDDGVTGLLVEDGDVEALAKGIAFLADHPEERRKMGEAARRLAASEFVGWDERTSMEFDLIESLLQ